MSLTTENIKIISFDVKDIRFPTSLEAHGSDAMHTDPDYSCVKKGHVLGLFLDLNLLQEKSRKENKNGKEGVRSNEILGWGGVGNRQLLCFFTA
jgi:hypothetical protein